MRAWSLIAILLLFYSWTMAQHNPYSFRTIDINNGLSQNSVIDIANDDAGFLWFATQDGLNRYDGKEFKLFRKTFDDVTTTTYSRLGRIIKGPNHHLWLITSGGRLEKFNLLNHTSTPFKSLPAIARLPSVSGVHEESNGSMLIGTEREGLILYDPARPQAIVRLRHRNDTVSMLTSDSIQYLLKNSKGEYLVLTSNGITVVDPGTRTANKHYLYHPAGPAISCSVAEEDAAQTIWVGTYGKGLYCKAINDTSFIPFTGYAGQNIPSHIVVQAIRADKQGRIWVGTFGDGLFIIHTKEARISHFLTDNSNPFAIGYNDILSLQTDKQGGMWIGTDGSGVSYYDKRLNIFTQLTKNTLPKDVPIEQVRSITTDADGGLWIGTSASGLTYSPDIRNNQAYKPVLEKEKSNDARVVSLLADKEDIWIGVQGNGLLIMDRKTRKVKKRFTPSANNQFFLPDHTILCMKAAGDNLAWLGTRNAGLCLLDKQKGLIHNYRRNPLEQEGIADNNIRSLCTINDSILCIGFENEGIQFFNTYTGRFIVLHEQAEQQIRAEQHTLKCVYYQAPNVWIGTLGHGITVLNLETGKRSPINEENGLPNNTIYSIVRDKMNFLWMSTNKGITRFTPPANLASTHRNHFSLFTTEDGLQSNEFNTGAWHTDANGIIYFGGINGLSWFDPVKYLATAPPANVVITQATVNNEPWQSDTSITYKKLLELPYDQNALSFNFAALDFVSPGKFNYYYKLESYDKNWINAGNRNYAAYTNLPPGKYIFQVKASGQSAGGNDPITSLTIIITPPFWKTWWFTALCILAIASLLYLFYRYRINQLIAMQKVRNRIATDLHDDIGSTLTNISILSELSRQKLPAKQETQVFLDRISEEVTNSSQALDDIVWSINANNDTLDQTVARMRRYAAEIFDSANIQYSLHLDDQFARRKLTMEQRRDCFLLFKESINNIYKHAAARSVAIRLWLEKGRLHMTIEDDGRGFDPAQLTHRNGLKNMQQRVLRWNGTIHIDSAPGKGTRTSISFDVQ